MVELLAVAKKNLKLLTQEDAEALLDITGRLYGFTHIYVWNTATAESEKSRPVKLTRADKALLQEFGIRW